jgi:hypothetical protein
VRVLVGLSVCLASSAKQIHAPSLRAILLPVATSFSARWPRRRHHVPPRGAPAPGESTHPVRQQRHTFQAVGEVEHPPDQPRHRAASSAGPAPSLSSPDRPAMPVPAGRPAVGSAWSSGQAAPWTPTPRPALSSRPHRLLRHLKHPCDLHRRGALLEHLRRSRANLLTLDTRRRTGTATIRVSHNRIIADHSTQTSTTRHTLTLQSQ